MDNSTSILDLPTDPVGGGSISNNISLTASEPNIQESLPNSSSTGSFSLDQNTISQIVNGLQQASLAGATQLSSRDIPMITTTHSNDAQIQPNYVPPPPLSNPDYVKEYEEKNDIIYNYNKNIQNQNSIDSIYSEIQIPLLVVVLYFLFQLPFFKKNLFHYLPVLFSKDGNFNINGLFFTSILFGILFYFINKVMLYFDTF